MTERQHRKEQPHIYPDKGEGWEPISTAPMEGDIEIELAAYIVPSPAAAANGSRPFWDYGKGRHLWSGKYSGILGMIPSHWRAA